MNRIPLRFRDTAPLLKVAIRNWQDDDAPRMGAALAYYIALSLAPTVLILLAVIGWGFAAQAATGRLMSQIQILAGHEGAKAIQIMIEDTRQSSRGVAVTLLGLIAFFLRLLPWSANCGVR